MQGAEGPSAASARLAIPARLTVLARSAAGPARMAVGLAALAAAAGSLVVAERYGRGTTYAGSSAFGAALTLTAGVGLTAAGLVIRRRRGSTRTGDLALLAGLCWFAPLWAAWEDGPQLIPSVAMVAGGFTFPFIVHLVLTHPAVRAASKPARVLVASVYLEASLTTAALALFRDPYLDPGCLANCNVNDFLVRSLPSLAHGVQIGDRWFAAAAAGFLITLCVVRLVGASGPARRRLLPVYLPAAVFAVAVISRVLMLQRTVVEDPFNTGLFTIFAAGSIAIVLLSTGLIAGIAPSSAERRAVARIAANLGAAPVPGSLQAALAAAVRDPGLQIAYWLPGAQSYVDASGQAVAAPSATSGRAVTQLTRRGRTVAVISHSGAVHGIEMQIGPAIRLGLENEQLQAELLAQVEELRASRTRIVETADAERRVLERNLHDGAQQRLLALSYEIRLARAAALSDGDAVTEKALATAVGATHSVLAELRDLAHGIYPAVLAESGLGPALATLADTAPLPVEILHVEHLRHPAAVEAAAYFTVAEALDDAARRGARHATVSATHEDGRLVVTIEATEPADASHLVAATDRIVALGGSLTTGPAFCRAEIPCAS